MISNISNSRSVRTVRRQDGVTTAGANAAAAIDSVSSSGGVPAPGAISPATPPVAANVSCGCPECAGAGSPGTGTAAGTHAVPVRPGVVASATAVSALASVSRSSRMDAVRRTAIFTELAVTTPDAAPSHRSSRV